MQQRLRCWRGSNAVEAVAQWGPERSGGSCAAEAVLQERQRRRGGSGDWGGVLEAMPLSANGVWSGRQQREKEEG